VGYWVKIIKKKNLTLTVVAVSLQQALSASAVSVGLMASCPLPAVCVRLSIYRTTPYSWHWTALWPLQLAHLRQL
jgi:hypothetical protein